VAIKAAEKLAAAAAAAKAAAEAAAEAEETRIFLEIEKSATVQESDLPAPQTSEDLADPTPDTSLETVRRNLTLWPDCDDSAEEKSQDGQSEAVAEDADSAMVLADAEEYAQRIRYDANNPATPARKARHERWESPLAPTTHSVVLSPDRVDDQIVQPEPSASMRACALSLCVGPMCFVHPLLCSFRYSFWSL